MSSTSFIVECFADVYRKSDVLTGALLKHEIRRLSSIPRGKGKDSQPCQLHHFKAIQVKVQWNLDRQTVSFVLERNPSVVLHVMSSTMSMSLLKARRVGLLRSMTASIAMWNRGDACKTEHPKKCILLSINCSFTCAILPGPLQQLFLHNNRLDAIAHLIRVIKEQIASKSGGKRTFEQDVSSRTLAIMKRGVCNTCFLSRVQGFLLKIGRKEFVRLDDGYLRHMQRFAGGMLPTHQTLVLRGMEMGLLRSLLPLDNSLWKSASRVWVSLMSSPVEEFRQDASLLLPTTQLRTLLGKCMLWNRVSEYCSIDRVVSLVHSLRDRFFDATTCTSASTDGLAHSFGVTEELVRAHMQRVLDGGGVSKLVFHSEGFQSLINPLVFLNRGVFHACRRLLMGNEQQTSLGNQLMRAFFSIGRDSPDVWRNMVRRLQDLRERIERAEYLSGGVSAPPIVIPCDEDDAIPMMPFSRRTWFIAKLKQQPRWSAWAGCGMAHHLWWHLMTVLLWDNVTDRSGACAGLWRSSCQTAPLDWKTEDFFGLRRSRIEDRLAVLIRDDNMIRAIGEAYTKHEGTFLGSARWDLFKTQSMMEEFVSAATPEVVIRVMYHLLDNPLLPLPKMLMWKRAVKTPEGAAKNKDELSIMMLDDDLESHAQWLPEEIIAKHCVSRVVVGAKR